jgi:hypothetical protein
MLRRRRRANRRRPLRVRPQLTANAAVFLVSTAGSIVIYYGAANPSGGNNGSRAGDEPAYVLLAFLLSVLGIWLVLLAFVADRFPAAATLGEAIAMALRGYFFGGGRN